MIKLTNNRGAIFLRVEDIKLIRHDDYLLTIINVDGVGEIFNIKETPEQVYELMKKRYESLP